jgi:hypothetical protein
MAKATYIVTKDFKTPYITSSHDPRNPIKTNWKAFRKGDLIAGELKHANNKPAFVLYNGVAVIPLSVIKAVVTKEILSTTPMSSVEGNTELPGHETTKKVVEVKNKKVTYMDAMLVGAVVGLGAIFLANKKMWIKVPNNINYAYGAGAGAFLAAYIIYRKNNKPKIKAV